MNLPEWESQAQTLPVEVTLAHVAAISGLSEKEYIEKVTKYLSSNKLLDLLNLNAVNDLSEWIGNSFLGTSNLFCIELQLSANKKRDMALYCICTCEENIRVHEYMPGFVDELPEKVSNLERFELALCDLKMRI